MHISSISMNTLMNTAMIMNIEHKRMNNVETISTYNGSCLFCMVDYIEIISYKNNRHVFYFSPLHVKMSMSSSLFAYMIGSYTSSGNFNEIIPGQSYSILL